MKNININIYDYNKFIKILKDKEVFIKYKEEFYTIKKINKFDIDYMVKTIPFDKNNNRIKTWYTIDLFDFIVEKYILLFIEE